MTVSKSQIMATRKYNEKTYDRIELTLKKGLKEKYKEEAKKRGLSMSQFIVECLEKEIDNNKES